MSKTTADSSDYEPIPSGEQGGGNGSGAADEMFEVMSKTAADSSNYEPIPQGDGNGSAVAGLGRLRIDVYYAPHL